MILIEVLNQQPVLKVDLLFEFRLNQLKDEKQKDLVVENENCLVQSMMKRKILIPKLFPPKKRRKRVKRITI